MYYQYPFTGASEQLKLAVWNKGKVCVQNGITHDATIWRWDAYGNVMKYSDHGNTNSKHGWEIDHIYPVSRGGSNTLDNLQPLQWQNNRSKGDRVS